MLRSYWQYRHAPNIRLRVSTPRASETPTAPHGERSATPLRSVGTAAKAAACDDHGVIVTRPVVRTQFSKALTRADCYAPCCRADASSVWNSTSPSSSWTPALPKAVDRLVRSRDHSDYNVCLLDPPLGVSGHRSPRSHRTSSAGLHGRQPGWDVRLPQEVLEVLLVASSRVC
jgi:hypothetical protein